MGKYIFIEGNYLFQNYLDLLQWQPRFLQRKHPIHLVSTSPILFAILTIFQAKLVANLQGFAKLGLHRLQIWKQSPMALPWLNRREPGKKYTLVCSRIFQNAFPLSERFSIFQTVLLGLNLVKEPKWMQINQSTFLDESSWNSILHQLNIHFRC